MTRRARVLAALTLAGTLTLAGCSGDTTSPPSDPSTDDPSNTAAIAEAERETACADVTTSVLEATQGYVDNYGAPLDEDPAAADTEQDVVGDDDLKAALETAQANLQRFECDVQTFDRDLRAGLAGINARGAVARAVLLQLEASMTGAIAPQPQTVSVQSGEDLPRALAKLAPGSTVELSGTFAFDDSLVLLQEVTIRGEGRNRTAINSSAADAGILVLTDGRVELSRLTVRHRGKRPANVLIGGPSSSVVLDKVRIADATAKAGSGGTGVLMSAREGEVGDRGTTLEVTGSQVTSNDAAGVLLSGGHRASIVGSTFEDNGQCGVCFSGASTGAVRDAKFTDNGVGVASADTSRPLLVRNTFTGGNVGVQASGRATPVVRRATFTGMQRAGMIFSEKSRGRIDNAHCRDLDFGIVVSAKALPYLGDNDCSVARSE